MRDSNSPVENLIGATLENGWLVVSKIESKKGHSGGNFSAAYEVHDENGKEYFLKALDLSRALDDEDDPIAKVNALTDAYLYEKQLFEDCKGQKLSRVVKYLDTGYVIPTNKVPEKYILIRKVPYLLFEMAEPGLRAEIEEIKKVSNKVDLAWGLRAMHHVSTGLAQLHQIKIAHRDLKPSNIVKVKNDGHKITDLGCAKKMSTIAPRDSYGAPGDFTYMPLEYYYSTYNTNNSVMDWYHTEISTDFYMLGGLAYYLLTNVSLTASIMSRIHVDNKFPNFRGFYADVLSYLIDAWDQTLEEFSQQFNHDMGDSAIRLSNTIRELTHPDPSKRGNLKSSTIQSQYQTRNYITKFNLLASRAEQNLFRID